MNNDGFDDVIIGAPNAGKAYVYNGSTNGLYTTASWTATGSAGDQFGISVASAGDVNNDGFDDVIIGEHWSGNNNAGKAYVFHGSTNGLYITANWTATGSAGSWFGRSVASAGDVNGNGYDDIIVGAPMSGDNAGKAYVFHGSTNGLYTTASWTATGNNPGYRFGYSVASAGDADGGKDDVIIGAPDPYTEKGQVSFYSGSGAGLSRTSDWSKAGEYIYAWYGFSVASAGDVDGNGFDDVIVGAYGMPIPTEPFDSGDDAGKAYVYYGNRSTKVGYWPFNEDHGDIVYDETHYQNDGTITGAPWISGFNGSALYFRGGGQWYDGDCVRVPHSTSLDITGEFTIEAWIKATGTDTYLMIVDKYYSDGVAINNGFSLYLSAGKLRLSIYSGTTYADVIGPSELRDNTWHHVAGMWDGSYARVYVDKKLEGEVPYSSPPTSTTNDLGIGKRLYGWGGYMPFNGTIDEVRIFLDSKAPELEITKPKEGHLYLFDKEIILIPITIIIGQVTVEVDAFDEIGGSGIDRVKFYIDDELKATDTSLPHEWLWDKQVFFKHTIKVVAYDNAGYSITKELLVWKFL